MNAPDRAAAVFDVVTVTLNPAIDETVTITNFEAGAVNRVEQVRMGPGGKGVNVAATLAALGLRVGVSGFLGRENAVPFESLFARLGIEDQFVRIEGQTRVGIKIVDPARQQTTDVNFPGQAPEPSDLAALRERLDALNAGWVVLAGSLPPGVPPRVYADLIEQLHARGRRVVLDTSGEALRHAIAAGPDVIKPNVHELEDLVGHPLADRAAVVAEARRLIAGGIGMVVVSLGAEGACFVTADEVVVARPPSVTVQSTVGGGDALVAGIVASRVRGTPLAACAQFATALALARITSTETGPVALSAVDAYLPRVAVQHDRPAATPVELPASAP
ncbi:MAG: 1-phosphofructokinase [Chloroflexi bacterium]|nr:1-phosphofructokinase [Chloroflexota bacterium]